MGEREVYPPEKGTFQWVSVIRRARLGKLIAGKVGKDGQATRGAMSELAVTAIALCWASYADGDGNGIYAGDAAIAVDLGTTIKAVAAVRKKLLELGLMQHVRGRQKGRGEEYRLTFPSDLFENVEVPDPDEHRRAALKLREAARGKPREETSGGPVDPPKQPCGGSSGPAHGGSSGPAYPTTDPTNNTDPTNVVDARPQLTLVGSRPKTRSRMSQVSISEAMERRAAAREAVGVA